MFTTTALQAKTEPVHLKTFLPLLLGISGCVITYRGGLTPQSTLTHFLAEVRMALPLHDAVQEDTPRGGRGRSL